MVSTWVFVIIICILGGLGSLICHLWIDSTKLKITAIIICVVLTVAICSAILWWLYCSESGHRAIKTFHSEMDGGIYRIVKVYDMEGDLIKEYKGKFDIEEQASEGVVKVKFDCDGKRHIIYGQTGTIIIDEVEPEQVESDDKDE